MLQFLVLCNPVGYKRLNLFHSRLISNGDMYIETKERCAHLREHVSANRGGSAIDKQPCKVTVATRTQAWNSVRPLTDRHPPILLAPAAEIGWVLVVGAGVDLSHPASVRRTPVGCKCIEEGVVCLCSTSEHG